MSSRTSRLSPSSTDLDLVTAAQRGDANAFDRLVDRYRRFVRSRCRGFFLVGGDAQDLQQEALIGFYKSVRDFDPTREAPFRSFAELCIHRQIISAVKAANRKKHQPLNQSVSFSARRPGEGAEEHEDDLPAVADALADPAEQFLALERLAVTHDALAASLSPLERDVLTRFVDGASYEDIASDLGRHTKAVDNALQRIKRKVGEHLETQREAEVDALV